MAVCPLLAEDRDSKGRRGRKALAEHMPRRGEMEHQSLAVFMACMSGSPPEFFESVYD